MDQDGTENQLQETDEDEPIYHINDEVSPSLLNYDSASTSHNPTEVQNTDQERNLEDQRMSLYISQLPIIHSKDNEVNMKENQKMFSYFLNRLKNTQKDLPTVQNAPESPMDDESLKQTNPVTQNVPESPMVDESLNQMNPSMQVVPESPMADDPMNPLLGENVETENSTQILNNTAIYRTPKRSLLICDNVQSIIIKSEEQYDWYRR